MNTTTNSKLKKIVLTALFAALSCVATMSIKLPTPGTGGYIHPGDAMVILSGVVLGSLRIIRSSTLSSSINFCCFFFND